MVNQTETPQTQTDPNVIQVTFDEAARHEAFMTDLRELPKGEQGFLGAQYLHNKRTGGMQSDEQGNPVQIPKPDNPFEG